MSNIVIFDRERRPSRKNVRQDSFRNLTTGFGTSRDSITQFEWYERAKLDKRTRDSVYAQHPLSWKLVDYLPDKGLRKWVHFDHDASNDILKVLKDLSVTTTKGHRKGFRYALNEAAKSSRKDGAALLYVQHQGVDPSEPLDWNNLPPVVHVDPVEWDYVSFGLDAYAPDHIVQRSLRHTHLYINGQQVHRDHLIELQGLSVGRDYMLNNNGKCQSIIDRCFLPLMFYSISHGMIPQILKDFIRDVVKIQGLTDLAENDCDDSRESFQDRLDYMMLAQSMINKLVLDTDDEFIRQTTSVSGINDLIRNPEKHLVAASGFPHTLILGEDPGGGIGNEGGAQREIENSFVSSYQEDDLRGPIEQMLRHILPNMGITDDVPVIFNPLDTPSQEQQATTFNMMADAVSKLVAHGIITPSEAATVFEGTEVKTNIVLNEKARAMLSSLELKGVPHGREEIES